MGVKLKSNLFFLKVIIGFSCAIPLISFAETKAELKTEPQQKPAIKKVVKKKRRLKNIYAILNTTIDGTEQKPIKIKLHHRIAKKNVKNFVGLAEGKIKFSYNAREFTNTPFYDGLKFHVVIKNFIIQTGDPTETGKGYPGYYVEDEFHPILKHNKAGVVGMASSGLNKNGSQFYITLGPQKSLNRRYTIIGQVIEGIDTVKAIGNVKTNIAKSKPIKPVVLKKVTIEREFH